MESITKEKSWFYIRLKVVKFAYEMNMVSIELGNWAAVVNRKSNNWQVLIVCVDVEVYLDANQ